MVTSTGSDSLIGSVSGSVGGNVVSDWEGGSVRGSVISVLSVGVLERPGTGGRENRETKSIITKPKQKRTAAIRDRIH